MQYFVLTSSITCSNTKFFVVAQNSLELHKVLVTTENTLLQQKVFLINKKTTL